MTKFKIEKYLAQHVNYTPFIEQSPNANLKVSIVIPMYKEEEILPTLTSIFDSESDSNQYEVICVVNHPEDATTEILSVHWQCLQTIKDFAKTRALPNLFAIDLENVNKDIAGVGHARKTGMDEALMRFDKLARDGLIVCMDGDTVVDFTYINELLSLYHRLEFGFGYSFSFEHQVSALDVDRPILEYELHLRYYMHVLQWAGHPHSIYTIGSAMGCTCSGYVQQGGMNQRKAGEDFYFMQKFAKSGKWKMIPEVMVYPSGRPSDRVPFGTGKAVAEFDQETGFMTYGYEAARLFVPLFTRVEELFVSNEIIDQLHPALKGVLADYEIYKHVNQIRQRSQTLKVFVNHFFTWMDTFKVMRILHQLREQGFADQPVLEAVNAWSVSMGQSGFASALEALDYFRDLDRRGGK